MQNDATRHTHIYIYINYKYIYIICSECVATESCTVPEKTSSQVEFKQFVSTRMILPLVGWSSIVSKSRVAVQDLKNCFFRLEGLDRLDGLLALLVSTLTPLSQLPEESREYREPLEFMRKPGGSGPGSPGSPGSPNSMALPSSENAFVIEDSGTLHVFPLL